MNSQPFHAVILEFNNHRVSITDPGDFEGWLEKIQHGDPGEYWLINEPHGNLCLLSDGKNAFLMLLPDAEGEHPGFTAQNQNPEIEGTAAFRLGNGQVDEYPRRQVISLEKATETFKHFYIFGKRTTNIQWSPDE